MGLKILGHFDKLKIKIEPIGIEKITKKLMIFQKFTVFQGSNPLFNKLEDAPLYG